MPSAAERFLAARDFVLRHRTDYDAAVRGFEWPLLDRFNWALDYFDPMAAGNASPALHIAEEDGSEVVRTFAQLSADSSRVANWLRALGARRGDRLLLMLGNEVPLWETFLAAMKLGVVVSPATTLLTPDDIRDRIARGAIRFVVADAACADRFAGQADLTRIAVGAGPSGWHRYDESGQADDTLVPDGETHADDPMLLYFTSGTTARPKLVMHTHQSYPVGHLSTLVLARAAAGRPPLEHQLAGLGQACMHEGRPADEGEISLDLRRRPLGLTHGYADDEQATAQATRDGFYRTGDSAVRDADGYLTYVGRADDVFKASDYRISPFELESVLIEHAAVAEAAVVPSPDPIRHAVPKAFVTPAAATSRAGSWRATSSPSCGRRWRRTSGFGAWNSRPCRRPFRGKSGASSCGRYYRAYAVGNVDRPGRRPNAATIGLTISAKSA